MYLDNAAPLSKLLTCCVGDELPLTRKLGTSVTGFERATLLYCVWGRPARPHHAVFLKYVFVVEENHNIPPH